MSDNLPTESSEVKPNTPPSSEPQKTIEEVAMGKVKDIEKNQSQLLNHETEIEKIPQILKDGILPDAKFPESKETWWAEGLMPRHGPSGQVKNNQFVRTSFLIDKPEDVMEEPAVIGITWNTIQRSVPPSEFKGMLLLDISIVNFDEGWEKSGQEAKDFALKEAERIANEYFTPENALPIFGTSGDLLWPQQIPADKLGVKPQTTT